MQTSEILKDWDSLNAAIMELEEDQLVTLKKAEQKGQNRLSYLTRIQGRINKLRSRREQAELIKG